MGKPQKKRVKVVKKDKKKKDKKKKKQTSSEPAPKPMLDPFGRPLDQNGKPQFDVNGRPLLPGMPGAISKWQYVGGIGG